MRLSVLGDIWALVSAGAYQPAKSILLKIKLSQKQDAATVFLLDLNLSPSNVDRDPLEREGDAHRRGHLGPPGAYQVNDFFFFKGNIIEVRQETNK